MVKNDVLKLSELSREQILDLADATGRKLGFLLSTSPLTDEQKEAIVNLLQYATPAQIDKLLEVLENGYLLSQNKELEDAFMSKLEKIQTELGGGEKLLEEKTLKQLQQIESKIK